MSIRGLFNQTITIYPKSGYDGYGRETAGTGVSVQARFQKTTKQRLLPNGSLTTVLATIYVPSDTAVSIDDKVAYGGVNYKVHGRYDSVDGTGNTHHIKLELVKWLTA